MRVVCGRHFRSDAPGEVSAGECHLNLMHVLPECCLGVERPVLQKVEVGK